MSVVTVLQDLPGRARAAVVPWRPRHLWTLALVVVLVAWFFTLRPVVLGGPALYVIVRGNSMEPGLSGGDLAVLREQSDYEVGDVISYRVPDGEPGADSVVIHRIVGGSNESGFVTQGDNREQPDQWRPRDDDVLGEVWIQLPSAGKVLNVLRRPVVLAAASGAFAAVLVLTSGSGRKRSEPS